MKRILVAMLLLATACTGSINEQVLRVLETSPGDGESSVSLQRPVVITFDGALDAESVQPDSSTLSPGVVVDFDVDGDQLVLLPRTDLTHDTQYTITLDQYLADTDGRLLLGGYTFDFSTRSRTWEASEPLWPSSTDATLDWAAFSTNQAGDSVGLIAARYANQATVNVFRTRDGVWEARAEPLDSATVITGIAVGNDGENGAIATWLVGSSPATMHWSRLGPQGWSEPQPLTTAAGALFERHPGIGTTISGSSLLWYADVRDGEDKVLTNLYENGWQGEVELAGVLEGTLRFVDGTRNEQGDGLVYWLADNVLTAASYTASGGWSESAILTADDALAAQAVPIRDGAWMVLWEDDTGLRYRIGNRDGTWDPIAYAVARTTSDPIRYTVAGGGEGALLVWADPAVPRAESWRTAQFEGDVWEEIAPLDTNGPVMARHLKPRLAANSNGAFLATWTVSDETDCLGVRSDHWWPGDGWRGPKIAVEECAWVIGLSLGADDNGRLLGVSPGLNAHQGQATGLFASQYW